MPRISPPLSALTRCLFMQSMRTSRMRTGANTRPDVFLWKEKFCWLWGHVDRVLVGTVVAVVVASMLLLSASEISIVNISGVWLNNTSNSVSSGMAGDHQQLLAGRVPDLRAFVMEEEGEERLGSAITVGYDTNTSAVSCDRERHPPPPEPRSKGTRLVIRLGGLDKQGVGSAIQRFKNTILFSLCVGGELLLPPMMSEHNYSLSILFNGGLALRRSGPAEPVCNVNELLRQHGGLHGLVEKCFNESFAVIPDNEVAKETENCGSFIHQIPGNGTQLQGFNRYVEPWVRRRLRGIYRRLPCPTGSWKKGHLRVGIHVRWGDTARPDGLPSVTRSISWAEVRRVLTIVSGCVRWGMEGVGEEQERSRKQGGQGKRGKGQGKVGRNLQVEAGESRELGREGVQIVRQDEVAGKECRAAARQHERAEASLDELRIHVRVFAEGMSEEVFRQQVHHPVELVNMSDDIAALAELSTADVLAIGHSSFGLLAFQMSDARVTFVRNVSYVKYQDIGRPGKLLLDLLPRKGACNVTICKSILGES